MQQDSIPVTRHTPSLACGVSCRGGDIEDGETYLEAVIRELRERRVDVENDPSLRVSTPEIDAPLVEMSRSGISEIP